MMAAAKLGRLHHVGFVVASIEKALPGFLTSFEASNGPVIHDPLQEANVVFVRTHPNEYTQIELVEPAGERSPVSRFLAKGGGLNHLCYEVGEIEAAIEELKGRKAVIVSRPQPAIAFNGRTIAWAMTPEWLLIELLEAEH